SLVSETYRGASSHTQGPKSDDEWRHPESAGKTAIDNTHQRADKNPADNCYRVRVALVEHQGYHYARKRDHGPHRKIDSAGDYDGGHAESAYGDDDRLS